MLARVVGALRSHPAIGAIAISIEQPSTAARALGEIPAGVVTVASRGSAGASALHALKVGISYPVLLTTADHPLLDRAMLDHFLSRSEAANADLTVGLATADTILGRYPGAARTFLAFGRDRVSGCNLYGLLTPRALSAIEMWGCLDQVRKRPWRIAQAFGTLALLRYAVGFLDLESAFAVASKRLGLRASPVLMPFAEAAIDVDKPADRELVEAILATRMQ
jgi:hypothetical protein